MPVFAQAGHARQTVEMTFSLSLLEKLSVGRKLIFGCLLDLQINLRPFPNPILPACLINQGRHLFRPHSDAL